MSELTGEENFAHLVELPDETGMFVVLCSGRFFLQH